MKSKFVRRPSSVRPSFVRPSVRLWPRLSLKLLHGFLSNFSCGFPWAICPEVFFNFEKKIILIFLRIFFVFVNMGPYGSENFKMLLLLQIAAKSFETCPEFSPNGPHKNWFGIFEILSFRFLMIFFSKI